MEQNKFFPEIHGNFGFGCMRLPMNGGQVDYAEFTKMSELFLNAGFNYFDTAHGYIGGQSEIAIRECVSKKHDRSEFLLTNKLTTPYFNSQEDIRPFFEKQLAWCGVDYFDFYLMHAQDRNNYQKYKKCKAYETAYKFKEEGLIRHFGISFHDKAEVLDMILTEHPEVEVVQIQFNYLDYEDASVEARKVYEVCEKHDKPVLVMEPVKGGSLVNLPEGADKILRNLNGGSNASYAIRFAASFSNIAVVLSGMSNMLQMEDIGELSEKFDFVISSLAFHYIEDFSGVVKKINDLLNLGRLFVFSQEHPLSTCFTGGNRWTIDGNGKKLYANISNYCIEKENESAWFVDNSHIGVTSTHRRFFHLFRIHEQESMSTKC